MPGSSWAARARDSSLTPETATTRWPTRCSAAPRTAPTRPAPTTPTSSRAGRSSAEVTAPTYPPGRVPETWPCTRLRHTTWAGRGRPRSASHEIGFVSQLSSRAPDDQSPRDRQPPLSGNVVLPVLDLHVEGAVHLQDESRTVRQVPLAVGEAPRAERCPCAGPGAGVEEDSLERHIRFTSISARDCAPPLMSCKAARNSPDRAAGSVASSCRCSRSSAIAQAVAGRQPRAVPGPCGVIARSRRTTALAGSTRQSGSSPRRCRRRVEVAARAEEPDPIDRFEAQLVIDDHR